ncbi:hypothetical protein BDV12DRAFT_169728 [Aspergillus spectabilis]
MARCISTPVYPGRCPNTSSKIGCGPVPPAQCMGHILSKAPTPLSLWTPSTGSPNKPLVRPQSSSSRFQTNAPETYQTCISSESASVGPCDLAISY